MAFNVNISLKPFGWINPCGLDNMGITSMEREISRKVSMNQVRENIKLHLKSVFEIGLVMTSLQKMKIEY
ncbi:MAG: octanoyltransferase, partial [Desulfobacterales bacterium]